MLFPGAIWCLLHLLGYRLLLVEPLDFCLQFTFFFFSIKYEKCDLFTPTTRCHHLPSFWIPLFKVMHQAECCFLASLSRCCFWHKHTTTWGIFNSITYCYSKIVGNNIEWTMERNLFFLFIVIPGPIEMSVGLARRLLLQIWFKIRYIQAIYCGY